MAKTAVLMPYPDLKDLFVSLVIYYPRLSIMGVEYASTDHVASRAVNLVQEGCELIIARGLQARLIRSAVTVPVIEMRASTQDLAILVLELKRKVNPVPGTAPRLGIIGFFNMFHSTEQFNSLLDVDLRVYTVTEIAQYGNQVNQAAADGCLGVIGGEVVQQRAAELGLVSCFLSMGEESAREALESASLVGYSIDLLKRSGAEMNAMLDNTSSALLQVDEKGIARNANRLFYQLISLPQEEVIGQKVTSLISDLQAREIQDALISGQEIDASVVTLGNRKALMSITPVMVEGHISGAILTFQEEHRITVMDFTLRKEAARQGLVAPTVFDQIFAENQDFRALLSQLKRIARYPAPVLLHGEPGTGKSMLAQCIHNESLRQDGPFVMLDCSSYHPDDLDEKLFGRFSSRKDSDLSAVELARGGTLYLRQVELLSTEAQYKVLQLMRGRYLGNGSNLPIDMDVRLVFSTEVSLWKRVSEGSFRSDFYYALNALRFDIPPLQARREDIPGWFGAILTERCREIGRRVNLTEDAMQALVAFDWPGNLDQMASLCSRLVLLSEKRTITEEALLQHLRGITHETTAAENVPAEPFVNPRARELLELLNRCHGNREKAAAELGISKTTLWRRMKHYGISRDLTLMR